VQYFSFISFLRPSALVLSHPLIDMKGVCMLPAVLAPTIEALAVALVSVAVQKLTQDDTSPPNSRLR
jgi:hypothetical protein